ncbi:hypothetical protein V8C86DRAFT_1320313 [Haematococcus lacustris]
MFSMAVGQSWVELMLAASCCWSSTALLLGLLPCYRLRLVTLTVPGHTRFMQAMRVHLFTPCIVSSMTPYQIHPTSLMDHTGKQLIKTVNDTKNIQAHSVFKGSQARAGQQGTYITRSNLISIPPCRCHDCTAASKQGAKLRHCMQAAGVTQGMLTCTLPLDCI